jgi:hypothetical protein
MKKRLPPLNSHRRRVNDNAKNLLLKRICSPAMVVVMRVDNASAVPACPLGRGTRHGRTCQSPSYSRSGAMTSGLLSPVKRSPSRNRTRDRPLAERRVNFAVLVQQGLVIFT